MAETTIEREEELRTAAEVEEEKGAVEPQADGDSSSLEEELPVDGRSSGPPPGYRAEDADDPSAVDAEIQEDEVVASAEPEAVPDAVATPEGDNEFGPDQPLAPLEDDVQKTPQIDTNKV